MVVFLERSLVPPVAWIRELFADVDKAAEVFNWDACPVVVFCCVVLEDVLLDRGGPVRVALLPRDETAEACDALAFLLSADWTDDSDARDTLALLLRAAWADDSDARDTLALLLSAD